jgi:hypothetical protein
MPASLHASRLPRRWQLWLSLGFALRFIFIVFPRPVDDDTWDYLQLGHNLLHHGIYGTGSGANISPSLFRLPAYPIFLAVFEQLFARLFPNTWMTSVFLSQIVAELAACLLLAAFAHRHFGPRAAELALALAALCPFTAAYAGTALTESLSCFAIALGIYAADRALSAQTSGSRDKAALVLAGLASAFAMLLRPDGILLFAAVAAGFIVYILRSPTALSSQHSRSRRALATTSFYCLIALLPLVPWTLRNFATFHVFQPLAPRYLNDPGDRVNRGFYRWLRTWSIEYVTTANVFWAVGQDSINLADLPSRAFDSSEQRDLTLQLIAAYNRHNSLSADLDDQFAALAAERIRAHPIRYYVALPILRDADMLFRPRTEDFYLDVFWWRWSEHPFQTTCSIVLGLINLAYVALAAWAFLRRRAPWPIMLGGYLLMRFALLGSVENPEPRYTLECFPILIVAAAAAISCAPSFAVHRKLAS